MVEGAGNPIFIVHADDLDPIQGQGHGASEFLKLHFSKSSSSTSLPRSSKLIAVYTACRS